MISQPADLQETVQRWTGSACWDPGGKAAMTELATLIGREGRTKEQIRVVLCSPGKIKQTRTGSGAGNRNRHQAGSWVRVK